MLELLNQLDGFSSHSEIKVMHWYVCVSKRQLISKCVQRTTALVASRSITVLCYFFTQVIAATNRVDTLDPALLRSGTCGVYAQMSA